MRDLGTAFVIAQTYLFGTLTQALSVGGLWWSRTLHPGQACLLSALG